MTVVRGNTGVELDLPDEVIARFKDRPDELRLLIDTFADLLSSDRMDPTGAELASALQYAERTHRRAQKAELAAKGGAARWTDESEIVAMAIRQAAAEHGKKLRSKANASRVLKDRVNAILEGQGIASRSERTLEKHIPSEIL